MQVGDLVKVKGTSETYGLKINHKLGRIVALKADGEIAHVQLILGKLVKLSIEELEVPTEREHSNLRAMR